MRKKITVLLLLGAALEVAWLMGTMELLRSKIGSSSLDRFGQELKQAKSLIERAGEAFKAEQPSLEQALKELRGEPASSPGDPSRNPFALPPGVRLLAQPSGDTQAGSTETDPAKAAAPEPRARELNGILVGPRDRVAIIDGVLVRAGDSLEGERVIDVRRDHVVLARDGQRRTLHLPPPFPESKQETEPVEVRASTSQVPSKRSNGAPTP